jgi:hypothetical protein
MACFGSWLNHGIPKRHILSTHTTYIDQKLGQKAVCYQIWCLKHDNTLISYLKNWFIIFALN